MKKIIEFAERMRVAQKRFYANDDNLPRKVAYADLLTKEKIFDDALAERRQLEQTPITEEWLKEHGWEKKEMYWYYEVDEYIDLEWYAYESRLSRLYYSTDSNKGIEVIDKMHCFNLADLYDALELCDIQID